MSKFVCQNGVLYCDGTDFESGFLNLTDVNIDITASEASITVMGNDGWGEVLSTVKEATFSWTTALDDTLGVDLDATLGESCSLFFDSVDGTAYSAVVVITSISISTSPEEISMVNWEATCDGILIES